MRTSSSSSTARFLPFVGFVLGSLAGRSESDSGCCEVLVLARRARISVAAGAKSSSGSGVGDFWRGRFLGEGFAGEEKSGKGSLEAVLVLGFLGDCLIWGFLGGAFVKKSSKRST